MKNITKKEIQNTVSTALDKAVENLHITKASKKTKKALKKASKKVSLRLKADIKKFSKKSKSVKVRANGKLSKIADATAAA